MPTTLIWHKKLKDLKKAIKVEFLVNMNITQKGGVIHWTHHDPQRKHIDGWLKYKEKYINDIFPFIMILFVCSQSACKRQFLTRDFHLGRTLAK